MSTGTQEYVERLQYSLRAFPHQQLEVMVNALLSAWRNNKTIFVMGNGGSAATALHWACDFNKGCNVGRETRFRVMCLNENISTMLAYANDLSYEDIFVEQLRNFLGPGDVVIGISASGNSSNVLNAIECANANGGRTIGLCGFSGGRLYSKVHIPVLVEVDDMQLVEDLHLVVLHATMRRLLQLLPSNEGHG
jgi:D-sedoheptulose 7-phosphate isomerase